ncbi:hypothetical protein Tco_1545962 [Tanacetum coccineum]
MDKLEKLLNAEEFNEEIAMVVFKNILISLMDSIEKAIAERGLYKRVHDSKVNERTMQTHKGMISKDASEIDNNDAGASHDKDNITEVQSSINKVFAKILTKTKNTSEMHEKTKTDHKMLKEENVLLKKEIKAYKERVRDFNEKQYIKNLEQEKDELQDQVLKIKNATKAFKQDEDKYVNNIIQLEAKNKDIENIVCKMGKSSQTLRMLTNEQSLYRENKQKLCLGYTNPCLLGQAIACHPKLYDAEVLGLHYVKPDVHDTVEILNDAEENESDVPPKEMPIKGKLLKLFVHLDNKTKKLVTFNLDFHMDKHRNVDRQGIQQLFSHESYVEIKNKYEIERFSKESKDSEKFCNDVVEVKEKLSKQIVQLEKDFAKLDAQSIAFEIALQYKTQENNSLKMLQKENENFMASLLIENAHLKQTYKDLFESVQSSRFETIQCDENAFADEVKRATMGKLTAFDKDNCVFGSNVTHLEKIIAQKIKDFDDVKLELSNRTAKFEAYFEKLKNTKVVLERQ